MTRRERKQLGWVQTAEQEAENHCKSEAYYLIFKKKKTKQHRLARALLFLLSLLFVSGFFQAPLFAVTTWEGCMNSVSSVFW